MLLLKRVELVTIDVVYYRPDFTGLVNEFIWQTEDQLPDIPRVHRFLEYWRENIKAVIKDILVTSGGQSNYRLANYLKEIQ